MELIDKDVPETNVGKMELIDKQKAIDVILGQPPEPHYPSWYAGQIRAMPPVQPKRIKSKWALHTYMPHNKFCMACHNDSPYNKRWDFCPNCGADMRGERNE